MCGYLAVTHACQKAAAGDVNQSLFPAENWQSNAAINHAIRRLDIIICGITESVQSGHLVTRAPQFIMA